MPFYLILREQTKFHSWCTFLRSENATQVSFRKNLTIDDFFCTEDASLFDIKRADKISQLIDFFLFDIMRPDKSHS